MCMLMEGYSKLDVRDMTGMKPDELQKIYASAIDKIVEQNEYEWHRCMAARRKAHLV